MPSARTKVLSLLLATALATLAAGGTAAQTQVSAAYAGRHPEPWVAMGGLRFGTLDLDLVYDDTGKEALDVDYLTLEFADELAPNLLAGARIGRVSVSQSGRGATQGMSPDGFSLGLGMDWHYALPGDVLGVTAGASYLYYDVDGVTDEQDTDMSWHSVFARLGLSLRGGRLLLRAGGVYRDIDGRERTFGSVDATTDFELEQHHGSFVEIEFNTDPRGYVGLTLESGAARHASFFFQRFF